MSILSLSILSALRRKETEVPKAALVPVNSAAEDEEYETVAKAAGFQAFAGSLKPRMQFRKLLHELNIQIYDVPDVMKYLNSQITARQRWNEVRVIWYPIENSTRPLEVWWSQYDKEWTLSEAHRTQHLIYMEPIPLPVLITIKNIKEECEKLGFGKEKPEFYVSAFEKMVYPDPFLLVAFLGHTHIIERWDEPAFRTSK